MKIFITNYIRLVFSYIEVFVVLRLAVLALFVFGENSLVYNDIPIFLSARSKKRRLLPMHLCLLTPN